MTDRTVPAAVVCQYCVDAGSGASWQQPHKLTATGIWRGPDLSPPTLFVYTRLLCASRTAANLAWLPLFALQGLTLYHPYTAGRVGPSRQPPARSS